MAENRGQSGVRSLLAKFENNNNNSSATSPPSRGRSPAGSEQSGSGRPLSKVRASFVAVERSGQSGPILGLRKVNGADESPGKLRTGVSADDVGSPLERTFTGSSIGSGDKSLLDKNLTSSPPTNISARTGEALATDTQKPAIDAEAPPVGKFTDTDTPELGTILKGSSFEKSPQRVTKKTDATNAAPSVPEGSPTRTRETPRTANTNGKSKDPAPTSKSAAPVATKKVTHRPSNISINKDANKPGSKPSPTKASNSPVTSRAPRTTTAQNVSKTSSTRPPMPKPAADKDTTKAPIKKPSRMSLNPASKTTAKPQSSLPGKDAAQKQTTSTTTRTKTRTRSPTRPVNLPPSMTAQTASSAARLGTGGPTSRASSRAGTATTTLNRKPSSLKPSRPTGATTSRTTTVRKQPSRVSLSPQRSRAQDRPSSRVSARARSPDEGFLARMMRPTASSANKTHEKVEPKTPPKTKVSRPRKITSQASGRSSVEPTSEKKAAEPAAVNDKPPSIREPTREPTPEPAAESASEPLKEDTPENPAVAVVEETAEPPDTTTEPTEAAPESVEVATESADPAPVTVEPAPENVETFSESVEASPEPIKPAPEVIKTTPESVEAAPEPVEVANESVEVISEPVKSALEPVHPVEEPIAECAATTAPETSVEKTET